MSEEKLPAAIKPYDIKAMREIETNRLVKAEWNYKDDDEFKSARLQENLKRNGQIVNLIVRRLTTGYYEVLDGNHRLDAILKLAWPSVICYDLGEISDAKAKRIAVEINETRFTTNYPKLAQTIKDLKEEFSDDDLLATLPFTEREFQALEDMTVEFDWEKAGAEAGAKQKTLEDEMGGDRIKMEFMLTIDQAGVVNEAVARIVLGLKLEGSYRNSRALELIAADSMNTPLESLT